MIHTKLACKIKGEKHYDIIFLLGNNFHSHQTLEAYELQFIPIFQTRLMNMHQRGRSGHVSQHWPNVYGVTRVKGGGRLNTGSSITEKEWWNEE